MSIETLTSKVAAQAAHGGSITSADCFADILALLTSQAEQIATNEEKIDDLDEKIDELEKRVEALEE